MRPRREEGLRCTVLVLAAVCATSAIGCAEPPTTRRLAYDAIEAMGGSHRVQAVRSLVMKNGAGTRSRLGQSVRASAVDPKAMLVDVTETLDLAGGRAALQYEIRTEAGFTQQRQEILTRHGDRLVGLERVGGRPAAVMSADALFSWGTQHTPAMALRRNVITVALAAVAADISEVAEDRELAGRPVKFGRAALKDETIGIYFDPESHLIAAYETTDTEPILGDVPARYVLDDYGKVDGVMLPHRISISKGGAHYADVRFTSVSVNEADALAVFNIPTEAAGAAAEVAAGDSEYSPLTLTAIADDVYFAQGYSHHSLVVAFPSYLAVIEAPYTQAQSRTLVKLLSSQFPGKPVRYLAVTHPHFDHMGGVRSVAAAGATILVARQHEAAMRALLTARHTNPADDLDRNRSSGGKTGNLQAYDNKTVIAEGRQSIELHVVLGSPHADPIVMAYVPSAHLLFQSDLFSPGTGEGATPAAAQLLRAVRVLGLDVRTNAGGHGGVGPFDELVQAVGTP